MQSIRLKEKMFTVVCVCVCGRERERERERDKGLTYRLYKDLFRNTSCKMLGWMKHKLESRLPG